MAFGLNTSRFQVLLPSALGVLNALEVLECRGRVIPGASWVVASRVPEYGL